MGSTKAVGSKDQFSFNFIVLITGSKSKKPYQRRLKVKLEFRKCNAPMPPLKATLSINFKTNNVDENRLFDLSNENYPKLKIEVKIRCLYSVYVMRNSERRANQT